MNRSIRLVAVTILSALVLQILVLSYWQSLAAGLLQNNPLNIRDDLFRTSREHGLIISSDNQVLAQSIISGGRLYLYQRVYPQGTLYAHTVGFSSLTVESTGLEAAYETDLSSHRGFTVSAMLNALLGEDLGTRSLQITLHHGLTTAAAQAMGSLPGAVAAIDPQTGAVLALVTSPRFDPNLMTDPQAEREWENLNQDPTEPLKNRVLNQSYLPGDAFSIVVAAAALETGAATSDTSFPASYSLPGDGQIVDSREQCRGDEFGQISVEEALVWSCQSVVARLGIEAGASALVETAENLGFNRQPPLDLPLLPSVLPDAPSLESDLALLANISLGQPGVRATAFQLALAAAAVANDGVLMEPHLISRVWGADSSLIEEASPNVYSTPLNVESAFTLERMLENVVDGGTGIGAHIPGVRVAGKASTVGDTDLFVGFAPVGSPDIALAVVVETPVNGVTNRSLAASIAAEVIDFWLRGNPVRPPLAGG